MTDKLEIIRNASKQMRKHGYVDFEHPRYISITFKDGKGIQDFIYSNVPSNPFLIQIANLFDTIASDQWYHKDPIINHIHKIAQLYLGERDGGQ